MGPRTVGANQRGRTDAILKRDSKLQSLTGQAIDVLELRMRLQTLDGPGQKSAIAMTMTINPKTP